MSGERYEAGGQTPPARPGPPAVGPELTVLLRADDLLERTHAVESRINQRVRLRAGPGAGAGALAAPRARRKIAVEILAAGVVLCP
jgi:hypothetical protein